MHQNLCQIMYSSMSITESKHTYTHVSEKQKILHYLGHLHQRGFPPFPKGDASLSDQIPQEESNSHKLQMPLQGKGRETI